MGYASRRRPQVSTFVISPPRFVIILLTRSVAAVTPSSCRSGVSTNISSYSRKEHLLLWVYPRPAAPAGAESVPPPPLRRAQRRGPPPPAAPAPRLAGIRSGAQAPTAPQRT